LNVNHYIVPLVNILEQYVNKL